MEVLHRDVNILISISNVVVVVDVSLYVEISAGHGDFLSELSSDCDELDEGAYSK